MASATFFISMSLDSVPSNNSDPKSHLADLLRVALASVAPDAGAIEILIERPKQASHGDFASNLAMQLARKLQTNPREIAQKLLAALPPSALLEKAEIAGAGFINFTLAPLARTSVVSDVLTQGADFGRSSVGKGRKVVLEFVSANPTGPLHVGHGRQAALGDALSALFEWQGYDVTREFYYNDAGVQIQNLALSVQARLQGLKPGEVGWPESAYNGEYIQDIATDFAAGKSVQPSDGASVTASGNVADLDAIRRFAVAYLRNEQDIDLQKFAVKFDVFYLESSLYSEGRVDDVVCRMVDNGKTFESEGALWLRTTEYGDDKDRVMRKSDGSYTYFVPDVAYHVAKWQRGFERAINIQGSDHHSTVTRVRAGLQAVGLGIPQGYPEYVLHNMVKVMRGGEEVKISKRAGSYVTVRDLIEWVGRDAVRFFLVSRRADSEFVFDIDLALSKSEENPVYYVQYAHARICSVLRQWGGSREALTQADLALLIGSHELALCALLRDFTVAIENAANDYAPHGIAFYLKELAAGFHGWYNAERLLVDDVALKQARLALALAVRQTLANGLTLLGVSAPESM
jgi:arginyl-tRNA synthetase